MISSKTTEVHRQHEHMSPFEMLKQLENFYASRAKTLLYEILRYIFECKHDEGKKVSDHVLKLSNY